MSPLNRIDTISGETRKGRGMYALPSVIHLLPTATLVD
jgi:hypothetical protein